MQAIQMTQDQAMFIRHLRKIEELGWRRIHIEWQRRFVKRSEWWINPKLKAKGLPGPHGSQVTGMKLCIFAQNFLKDKW